jgi:hypothetical protein
MKKAGALLYKYPFLLFLLFLIIAYLPVFLPFFHLKNDIVTQNLPTRFVISESLYSGFFPWWNPYINFGIPQYGDMNTGFWNPFIWIIAKTTGYSIYSITIEEMFYILIGGYGFYKICFEFFNKESAIISGIGYMACGYILGHLQHFCWITGTAFFPYVILFFIRVHKKPILKNVVAGGFASFFFISAAHPGLIIGSLYFFIFFIGFIFLYRKTLCPVIYSNNFWRINTAFLLFAIALSSVVIYSYADVLQNVSRGLKLSREQMLMNPTTLQSYLSLLVPLAVNKSDFFLTDISMRNCYLGIAGLIGLIVFIKRTTLKITLSTLVPFLFFILLSAGGYFKIFFSKLFPLVGYVRMNGEFSYFAIFILLFGSAAGLHYHMNSKHNTDYRKILRSLVWLFCGLTIIAIAGTFSSYKNPFDSIQSSFNIKQAIKYVIDNLNFFHLLLMGSLLQLLSVLLLNIYIYSKKILVFTTALNLIITTWLILPFTGLGTRSKKEFTNTINVFEKGIHAPELVSINKTKYLDSSLLNDLWMIPSYSKKIGYPQEELYPIQIRSNPAFFSDHPLLRFITNQSYIFLSSDTSIMAKTLFDSSFIKIEDFRPGYIKAVVNNMDYKYITLLQNNYHYWHVKINNKGTSHFTGYKTFITAPIENGNNLVEFIFDPFPVKSALWVTIFFAIAGIVVIVIPKWRNLIFFSKKTAF